MVDTPEYQAKARTFGALFSVLPKLHLRNKPDIPCVNSVALDQDDVRD